MANMYSQRKRVRVSVTCCVIVPELLPVMMKNTQKTAVMNCQLMTCKHHKCGQQWLTTTRLNILKCRLCIFNVEGCPLTLTSPGLALMCKSVLGKGGQGPINTTITMQLWTCLVPKLNISSFSVYIRPGSGQFLV